MSRTFCTKTGNNFTKRVPMEVITKICTNAVAKPFAEGRALRQSAKTKCKTDAVRRLYRQNLHKSS